MEMHYIYNNTETLDDQEISIVSNYTIAKICISNPDKAETPVLPNFSTCLTD